MTHPDEPRWIERRLLDPDSPSASERRHLLEWMTEQGISVDDMAEANERGQLTPLAGDRALRPGSRMSPTQLAARLGVDLGLVHDIRRASGFPPLGDDEPAVTDDDVRMFELFQLASGFFGRDEVMRLAAVMGSSIRRIADAAQETFLRDVEAPLKAIEASTEIDMAKANLAGIGLARAATDVFAPMFLTHLEASTRRVRAARRESDVYDTVPLAVGFVDLSGFTQRSMTLTPTELYDLVVDFEMRASGLVGDHGGRVVKLIGDEVMFSSIDATSACTIALALIAAAPTGTQARGGLAFGDVVASGGDIYGPIVNLASRIADIAIPGEVLVNEALVDLVPTASFEPAGRRSLKGFSDPVRVWTLVG